MCRPRSLLINYIKSDLEQEMQASIEGGDDARAAWIRWNLERLKRLEREERENQPR